MTDRDDSEVEKEAKRIVKESLKMGDYGPIMKIDGDCVECGDIATWRSPISGQYYCEFHATEKFAERHG